VVKLLHSLIMRPKKIDPSKAVGVVRVSTSKQDIGAAAQRADLDCWATQNGIALVAVFEDVGVSGAAPLSHRPGLLAAIATLREHGAGKLVAAKRDRFARHRHTIADVERAVLAAGAVLVTTDGVCTGEDTESEEVQASVQDLVAALELRKIKARNKARAQRCIAEGRTHGGLLPYGFRRKAAGVRGRGGVVVELEEDPREQAIVARARALHAEGHSLRAIGAALVEEGLATRTGAPWQAMTVRRLIEPR
jgi:site-specific DNA recombinase